MRRYANLDGGSISDYEIGPDYIILRFRDREELRLYNRERPGIGKVRMMKRLALAGRGLDQFIERHVRDQCASRLDPVSRQSIAPHAEEEEQGAPPEVHS